MEAFLDFMYSILSRPECFERFYVEYEILSKSKHEEFFFDVTGSNKN